MVRWQVGRWMFGLPQSIPPRQAIQYGAMMSGVLVSNVPRKPLWCGPVRAELIITVTPISRGEMAVSLLSFVVRIRLNILIFFDRFDPITFC